MNARSNESGQKEKGKKGKKKPTIKLAGRPQFGRGKEKKGNVSSYQEKERGEEIEKEQRKQSPCINLLDDWGEKGNGTED